MKKVNLVSGAETDINEAIIGKAIRPGLFDLIKKDHPDFSENDYISLSDLNVYRRLYLAQLMEEENGELKALDREVMNAIRKNTILSANIEGGKKAGLDFGQRVADKMASFGGSWPFIISFFAFVLVWAAVNSTLFFARPFDPYPFILLNLVLSCLAAIQAPVIMMSQNRQEQKDRMRSEQDYKINLKAELEIKLLHEKMDHLMVHQNKRLLEIQEIQTDFLEDIIGILEKMNGNERKAG